MAAVDGAMQDYEVTEDGIIYQEEEEEEGEESDPLASESEEDEQDRHAREEVFGASIDDLIAESRRGRRGRRKRRRYTGLGSSGRKKSRVSDLPSHLTSKMGAATVAFMMKQFDEAEKTLKEIIAEAPKAAAPHRTLGLIYEEKSDKKKALDTFMIAAELDKQDRDLWKRNAVLWEEMGDTQRAIYCLSVALRGTRGNDQDSLRARGMLYMKVKKYRQAADSFIKLSKLVPTDASIGQLISYAYRMANEEERAVPALEEMLRYCERNGPRSADHEAIVQHEGSLAELVQMIVEIRLRQEKYYDASMILGRLQSRCTVTGRPMTFVQRLMLAICQHRLGSETLASPTFLEFMSSPSMVAKHRFFLWQVADACRDSGDYRKGLRAYSLLEKFDDEPNRVELFLHRATCHKEVGNRSAAREDLEAVLSREPRNVQASLRIVEFLSQAELMARSGRKTRKASQAQTRTNRSSKHAAPLVVADQPVTFASERKAASDVLRNADILYDKGDYRGYLGCIYPALETALQLRSPACAEVGSYCGNFVAQSERQADDGTALTSSKKTSSKELGRSLTAGSKRGVGNISGMSTSRLHSLGSTIMRVLMDQVFVDVAERLLTCFRHEGVMALAYPVTKLFESLAHLRIKNNAPLRMRMKLLDMIAAFAVKDGKRAYEQARLLLLEDPLNSDFAFAFTVADQYLGNGQDHYRTRSIRFLNRLVKKNPKSLFLLVTSGNCSSRGGISTSTYTVGLYLRAYKLAPHSPLLCLCVAVHILYVAMSRRVGNRNEMVLHAFAFLDEYRRCRLAAGSELGRELIQMETDYNIARAMHQLGLFHMASEMYLKVLTAKCKHEKEFPFWGDVRRDAAYNLAQIYKGSGSHQLASAVMSEFLVF